MLSDRLSIGKVAKAVGISRPTMSRFLSGKQPLSADALEQVCDWLGSSMDDYRGGYVDRVGLLSDLAEAIAEKTRGALAALESGPKQSEWLEVIHGAVHLSCSIVAEAVEEIASK